MFIRYGNDEGGGYIKKAKVYNVDEHNIKVKNVDSNARHIVERLQSRGYEAYIVGGAVRDLILGNVPKDFDIATSATPTKIRSIFKNSRVIGRRFRLVHVYEADNIYEVSTFRSIQDGSVGNRYGRIEEDVRRRDFSCNALYYDPKNELLIDYVDGFKDIKNHVLKPIIPKDIIFVEDPVRIIRAIKYSCLANLKIPLLLKWQLKREAYLLDDVSPSRLTEEINKIFSSCHIFDVVKLLFEFGIYTYIQPNACVFLYENKQFKDKYFESLKELNQLILKKHITRQADFLPFLIRDYIKLISNLDCLSKKELYTFVYSETRHFILPMNPQRTELEYAVKRCLENKYVLHYD